MQWCPSEGSPRAGLDVPVTTRNENPPLAWGCQHSAADVHAPVQLWGGPMGKTSAAPP